MAFSRLFCCTDCDAGEAVLTFAEEWAEGSPASAPERFVGYGKVAGLINRLWCCECQSVRPFVLVRLEPPAEHAVVAYAEAQRLGLTGSETGACATCTTALSSNPEGLPCPSCVTGTLHFTGEWEGI